MSDSSASDKAAEVQTPVILPAPKAGRGAFRLALLVLLIGAGIVWYLQPEPISPEVALIPPPQPSSPGPVEPTESAAARGSQPVVGASSQGGGSAPGLQTSGPADLGLNTQSSLDAVAVGGAGPEQGGAAASPEVSGTVTPGTDTGASVGGAVQAQLSRPKPDSVQAIDTSPATEPSVGPVSTAEVEAEPDVVATVPTPQTEDTLQPVSDEVETAQLPVDAEDASDAEVALVETAETPNAPFSEDVAADTQTEVVAAVEPAPETQLTAVSPEVAEATPSPQPAEDIAVERVPEDADTPVGTENAPTFDIIRVDAAGAGLVAGTAEPFSTVQVL